MQSDPKPSRVVGRLLGEDDAASAGPDEDSLEIGQLAARDEESREDPEMSFEAQLKEIVEEAGMRASTFEEQGVMTRNRGLVISTPNGRFQVSIVKDNRHW